MNERVAATISRRKTTLGFANLFGSLYDDPADPMSHLGRAKMLPRKYEMRRPARWPDQQPQDLSTEGTAMEVITRRGSRWLVSFFRTEFTGGSTEGHRLFLGIIDWSEDSPRIHQVSAAQELKEFGLTA